MSENFMKPQKIIISTSAKRHEKNIAAKKAPVSRKSAIINIMNTSPRPRTEKPFIRLNISAIKYIKSAAAQALANEAGPAF